MAALVHPYDDLSGGEWLRGNLHTHTNRSDGERDPQAVIDDYARRGYGFLMLSDHELLATEEYYGKLKDRGLLLIPGIEIGRGPHLLHVDAPRPVQPGPGNQQIINEIVAACAATGRGFAVVNHPDWEANFNHCTIEQLREWTGYLGLEIYNGVIGRLDGSSYALNKWDLLLSEGRRLWGFANDDCHRVNEVELGWNTAYVKERTVRGAVAALRAGRFYCSTGVTIKSIRVDGLTIRIETENALRIAAIQNVGKRFAVADAGVLEVQVPPTALYARFECWGAGERMAWTQPFFVEREPSKPDERAFIENWKVSPRLDAGLDQASAGQGDARANLVIQASLSPRGFTDVRDQFQKTPGFVYLTADVASESARQATLYLGYDGPIRVWLNGEELFRGPGANPAIVDQLALYAQLRRGNNRLVIALDSNGGQAWGLFGRVG